MKSVTPINGAAVLCNWRLDVASCRLALMSLFALTLLIMSYGLTTVQIPAEFSRGRESAVNNSTSGTVVMPKYNITNLLQTGGRIVPKPEIGDHEGKRSLIERLSILRQPRLFGLLGSNFSLAYNLTIGASNTLGNITVAAAPAPVYYYVPAPAPYYPYGYANPYGYYNPYAYNPYNYNPYASYYYG